MASKYDLKHGKPSYAVKIKKGFFFFKHFSELSGNTCKSDNAD